MIMFSILRLSQMQVQWAAVVGPSQLASEPEPKAPCKHAQGYTIYRNPSSALVERKEQVHLCTGEELDRTKALKKKNKKSAT